MCTNKNPMLVRSLKKIVLWECPGAKTQACRSWSHALPYWWSPVKRSHIFDFWEQHHCPTGTIACVKAHCPFFATNGQGCTTMVYPRLYDLKRHMGKVHHITDFTPYDLADSCQKVAKNVPMRLTFAQVTTDKLTNVFLRWLSVR